MPWDQCVEGPNQVATLGCIPILVQNIINAALAFSGFVALIFLIWAGITYTSSKGDPQKVESAKKTATYAIIGLVIIFLSFFIVGLISQLTGVSQISNPTL